MYEQLWMAVMTSLCDIRPMIFVSDVIFGSDNVSLYVSPAKIFLRETLVRHLRSIYQRAKLVLHVIAVLYAR
jgi:hypothetical protein